MSETTTTGADWPASVQQQVDQVCLRFEAAWKSGPPPCLETFLGELDDTARPLLFQELLALEVSYRYRVGDTPRPEEYVSRFPEHEPLVRPVFAEVLQETASLAPRDSRATRQRGTAPATMALHPAHVQPEAGLVPEVKGYELLEELGRGGMGVVYKARQLQPPRLVALKMLLAGGFASPEQLQRFRREGEAVARLRDGSVAQVYEVGEYGGLPYISMEYVAGGSLAKRLKSQRLQPRQAAELVEQLALTVHAIHECKVIHRDLKPANILLVHPDKPVAEWQPKVSDFGLAKQLDASAGPTREHQALGTYEYMAPEQVDQQISAVGPWTDIFALGAILYELLTGRAPLQRGETLETLRRVLKHEPVFPQRGRTRLERDLQTLCLKCLEKAPARRFGSAAVLAQRLRLVLDDKPIPERPPGVRERVGRVVRRYPVAVALVLLLLGATGGVAGFLGVSDYLSDPERVREDTERRLRAGEAMVLIGDTGPPRYFQWGAGEDMTLLSTAPRRPFSVSTTDIALIEFPYAAGLKRYRLRAEVRHDKSPGLSYVGIYCGRKTYGHVKGVERSSFVSLNYCDRGGGALDANLKRHSPLRVDFCYLEPHEYLPVHPRFQIALKPPSLPDFPRFQPAPWRELVMEVTPEQVRAFWNKEAGQRLEAATVSRTDLLELAQSQQGRTPAMHKLDVNFAAHGGLGLYVREGVASFRRVVLEPLPDQP